MFDILKGVFAKHRANELARSRVEPEFKPSDRRALAQTVPRMQTLAIQPLDLLPPCSVTFRDYALAVLRSEQVANPTDPSGYRALMVDCFVKRGILQEEDRKVLMEPAPGVQATSRSTSSIRSTPSLHPAAAPTASSMTIAPNLFIPLNAEIIVTEVVRANKLTREGRSLPEQIIVQYIWREDVLARRRAVRPFCRSSEPPCFAVRRWCSIRTAT